MAISARRKLPSRAGSLATIPAEDEASYRMIQRADGFAGLKALLPPPSRRGLVLIDPPYEDKDDYRKVKVAIEEAQRRFATGTYAVWYPALGRLDFFESALAFMAGYGLKSFLIAQSLNQIEKAYGANNSILDNCHVRVSFATNDERTAKRISETLGTATELRAQRNYAGHRLAPWLGHLMVSRQETARPLLTPGEVMQLPPDEAVVMVSSVAPIKAYFDKPTQKEIQPVTTMQIYWGAVPFVIIQIIMVALIIAFPEIVSSGLDKEEGLSADQVQMEMMNATQEGPADAASTEVPTTDSEHPPSEDPMKMMLESMNKDATKK